MSEAKSQVRLRDEPWGAFLAVFGTASWLLGYALRIPFLSDDGPFVVCVAGFAALYQATAPARVKNGGVHRASTALAPKAYQAALLGSVTVTALGAAVWLMGGPLVVAAVIAVAGSGVAVATRRR